MQFFNRPALVLPLVHRGMLHTMLGALSQMMLEAAASDGLVAMCPLFARRRYLPLISDLRFVLAIPGVPAYLLSQPDLVARWAGQLSRLQLLDSQRRVLGEHVLHEHEAWVHAFNFFIHLSSVFKLLLKPLAPAPAHALAPPSGVAAAAAAAAANAAANAEAAAAEASAGHGAVRRAPPSAASIAAASAAQATVGDMVSLTAQLLLVLGEWAEGHPFSPTGVAYVEAPPLEPGSPPAVSLLPVPDELTTISFHLPLHRFLGVTLQRLCAAHGGAEALASLVAKLGKPAQLQQHMQVPLGSVADVEWEHAAKALPDRIARRATLGAQPGSTARAPSTLWP